jgi:hypothetical protein
MTISKMNCMHCGKLFTEQEPSYLGLLLHRICYQVVGGQIDEQLPTLSSHSSHGDRQTDLLAQKVAYPPTADLPGQRGTHGCQYPAPPLDTGEMSLNEVLVRLGISKTKIPLSFDKYDFEKRGHRIFTGDCQEIWVWLREQKLIL